MALKIIDFDKENIVISIRYNDQNVAITKDHLLRLLLMEEGSKLTGKSHTKSLASIGKMAGMIRKKSPGRIHEADAHRLAAALRSFDGDAGGRRSSQAARWMREMLGWSGMTFELRLAIEEFLERFPGLETIPKRVVSKG